MSTVAIDERPATPKRALRYVGDRLLAAFGLLAMVLALAVAGGADLRHPA